MLGAQEYIKKKGIVPSISFQDKKSHIVKLVNSKIKTIDTSDGPKEGVAFLVVESGQPKRFFTTSESLIAKLAEIPEETTVSIVMKSRKREDGGFVNYYEVDRVKEEFTKEEIGKEFPRLSADIADEEIPVVEDVVEGY